MQERLAETWSKKFQPLVGKRIKAVRWMTPAEAENRGWDRTPIVIELNDGTLLFPSMDAEGNDAGALFLQPPELSTLPHVAGVI